MKATEARIEACEKAATQAIRMPHNKPRATIWLRLSVVRAPSRAAPHVVHGCPSFTVSSPTWTLSLLVVEEIAGITGHVIAGKLAYVSAEILTDALLWLWQGANFVGLQALDRAGRSLLRIRPRAQRVRSPL